MEKKKDLGRKHILMGIIMMELLKMAKKMGEEIIYIQMVLIITDILKIQNIMDTEI